MAFTLAEYKKQSQDPLKTGVIEVYLNNAPFLNYLELEQINGGALVYNRENALPDAGVRAIGSKYTADNGTVEQLTEALKIAGGKIEIDRALRKMYGDSRLATAIDMKTKALARAVNVGFFKGDGTGANFEGLQSRIGVGETIVQGDTALSLSNLRRAVVECEGDNKVIFVGQEMFLRLSDAKNDASLGGQITITQDAFGNPITYFAGVPVVMAGKDSSDAEILDFSETNTTTSIYVCSFGGNGVVGIENGGLETYAPVVDSVVSEIDIEWLVSWYIGNPKSAYRISGITDVAVVA